MLVRSQTWTRSSGVHLGERGGGGHLVTGATTGDAAIWSILGGI